MLWRIWLCDTRTGTPLNSVPAVSCTWERVLNDMGSGQTVFQLSDPTVAKFDMKAYTKPWSTTTVVEWLGNGGSTGKVVYAGINYRRPYNPATRELTVHHADLWNLLERRVLLPSRSWPVSALFWTPQTYSYATLIKQVLLQAQIGTNAGLNMAYTPNYAGSETRTYFGYELTDAATAIRDLMGSDGGPDVDFVPRWASGKLQWYARTGSPASPKLTEGQWDFPINVPMPWLTGVTLDEDATEMQTHRWGVGDGQEEDMLMDLESAGIPYDVMIDRVSNFQDAKTITQLQALTATAEKVNRNPVQQFTADLIATGPVSPADLQLGGTVNLGFTGDPWISGEKKSNRLIRFSGSLGETVELGMQPEGVI